MKKKVSNSMSFLVRLLIGGVVIIGVIIFFLSHGINLIQIGKNVSQNVAKTYNKPIPVPSLNKANNVIDSAKNAINQNSSGQTDLKPNPKVDYGKTTDEMPTESLAESVIDPAIKKQLNNETLTYDGQGSFYVNNNKSTIRKPSSDENGFLQTGNLNSVGQLSASKAVLDSTMYGTRDAGTASWEPAGYVQKKINAPTYGNSLFNKGHSIAAALTAGWSNFKAGSGQALQLVTQKGNWDSSEFNKYNVTTQTSWANQADAGEYGKQGYGQNYFEGLVRKKERQNGVKINYIVIPIYDGNDKVPSGTWMQALSSDGKLNFNVFVPNVMQGVVISYETGASIIK